jgi:hypothetical protein
MMKGRIGQRSLLSTYPGMNSGLLLDRLVNRLCGGEFQSEGGNHVPYNSMRR